MKYTCALLALNSLFIAGMQPKVATATTLYNGFGLPESQGWLAPGAIDSKGIPILDITSYQSVDSSSQAFTLQTNNIDSSGDPAAGYLGYTNYLPNLVNPSELLLVNNSFPTLNSNNGYSIFFDVAVNPVEDNDNNRAAFSVIAIGSDVTKGIELDFDTNRIFAQSDTISTGSFSDFTRAETSAGNFDTSNSNSYELKVNSSTYELFVNGDSNAILTGNLKDYEYDINTTDPNLPFNPYETENFLFFGDLTDKASGTFTLGEVRVESATTATSTPEGNSVLALALMGIGCVAKKLKVINKN